MLRLFLITALLSFSAFAEELFVCSTARVCDCPSRTETAFPTGISFDEKAVVDCRPLMKELSSVISSPIDVSATCFESAPNSLYDQMVKFPKNCGYKWKGFNRAAFRETVIKFVKTDSVLCDVKKHHSMCTSATFLAFLKAAKNLKEKGLVTDQQIAEWSDIDDGPAWKYINEQARPDLLLEELKLGEGKILRKKEIPNKNWPREGDLLQFWREDSSGHSVVFSGYLKDSAGKTVAICYWSANDVTNGYGKRCEPLELVNRMIIGRFNS